MRNRRVSRGLAPTSGRQSEPAPTTGTVSTCRRKCSVGLARVGFARVGFARVGFARVGFASPSLANPTGHFRRRVRAVAFSTQWEPPTSIQRRSARKLSFLSPRLCDVFRVCVSAELRAFPASPLRRLEALLRRLEGFATTPQGLTPTPCGAQVDGFEASAATFGRSLRGVESASRTGLIVAASSASVRAGCRAAP